MNRQFLKQYSFIFLFTYLLLVAATARDFYWENPEPVASGDCRFPLSANNGTVSAVIWQEIQTAASDSGGIWLSCRVFNGHIWSEHQRFAGPFSYTGEIPSIASVAVDSGGRILVSAVTAGNIVSVWISSDFGVSFRETQLPNETSSTLAPQICVCSDDSYLLFATRGGEDNFSLMYSRSIDGLSWSRFTVFPPAVGKKRAFLPVHAVSGFSDVVVFQAFYEGTGRASYQLYSTVSNDRGSTWADPQLITGFVEPGASSGSTAGNFENYHNQRACLVNTGSSLSLVWERARTSTEKYTIYYATLDRGGRISGDAERVSSGDGSCYNPDITQFDNTPTVVWFDNRRGVNRIYLARKDGYLWTETELSHNSVDAFFGRIVNIGSDIEVYWQLTKANNTAQVLRLAPDRSIKQPILSPVNFTDGGKGRRERVQARIRFSEDSSGIAGYAYKWARGAKPLVPKQIQHLPDENTFSLDSNTDGSWYLTVRVADYAGNWSAPTYLEYIRDTTPPETPIIADTPTDTDGFLSSNTFSLAWRPAVEDDIAGYSWQVEYLASTDYLRALQQKISEGKSVTNTEPASKIVPASFAFQSAAASFIKTTQPAAKIMTRDTSVSFTNRDNGIYAFSVSAIDSVGNIGKPAVYYFVLNKYIPHTYITYVNSKTDDSGTLSLSVIGRGFAENGEVTDMYLDRDGKAPWDVTLTRTNGQFRVANDRLITDISLIDVQEGKYRVCLVHPVRGFYTTRPILSVSEFGTVKFGDYRQEYIPPWSIAQKEPVIQIRPATILLYSLPVFALVMLFFSIYGIAGVIRESFGIRNEVHTIITGEVMQSEKKKRVVALRKRGVGLRFKLTFFTASLVISVVLLVSIPLSIQFSGNQERTLVQGLESRVNVLLDSLSSGARAYLPSQNLLELSFLPSQMSALDEALTATITGDAMDNASEGIDYVWSTNDPDIEKVIDTKELEYGKSRLTREENSEINTRLQDLDAKAASAVGELSEGISSLTQEGIKLALKTDAASVQRRDEIQTITRQLEEKLNNELTSLASKSSGSFPSYNPQALSRAVTRYVFYKPVLYRQGSSTKYVHGTVRVEISTISLLETVAKDRAALIRTTVYVALVAVFIGIIGALLLASIIISPIRKLAVHVAMIRDTEDKEDLDGKDLKLRSRDEIGLLGETINDMTHGLVKAAAASKDLTVGKEVQKMFIPLETDSTGRKLTCGNSSDNNADFFGYYEGAKGVSGDYFDYIKLDDRRYAVIKCDVAGKGVPAALIMVEVATLFLDFFKDWKYEKNGYKLDYIVSRINDLIESRGFKGRFAAFTLCIFDSVSGDVYFCNAGDNLVHIYEAASHKMKTIALPESLAAGVFPSFMVDMKGGFQVVKQHLNPGDVLFLYTDGIEEAKRLFRNANLEVQPCAEPGLEPEATHGSHSVGQDNEELGPDRVNAIIEAVFARQKYSLYKWHNPEGDVHYDFDFTSCHGSIEEAILALVSVEKIFRMYRDPKATEFDRVQVDRNVDAFLDAHFVQYDMYCGNKREHPEYAEYLYYTHIKEDSQYDDLTILGIRKK